MSPAAEPGRLNGWKEIAQHLGKGLRTVQRWEKLYGLPVHRLGREGGEIVFAFRDEIDRWAASSARDRAAGEGDLDAGDSIESAPPVEPGARDGALAAPATRVRWALPLALVTTLAAVAAAAGVWRVLTPASPKPAGRAGAHGPPVAWRLANESLIVLDAAGAIVFEHRFGFALQNHMSSELWTDHEGKRAPVTIGDIDGDDRLEVLATPTSADRKERRLYCFEETGRVRWTQQPRGTRRFGDDEYAEPWLAHRLFITRGPSGVRRVWAVFTHNLLFPSVLQELDPKDGRVRQEYWSSGYVEVVSEASWAGRPVVLAGGTSNDFRAASLAVFAPDRVAGSTPVQRPAYACRDCAPGGPEALYVFPTICTSGRSGGQAGLFDVWVENGDRVRVGVTQVSGPRHSATYYTVGADGTLLGAEISREFQAQHALLERQGVLDHPFGRRDDADMFPVKRWDGRRFVDLPPVHVDH